MARAGTLSSDQQGEPAPPRAPRSAPRAPLSAARRHARRRPRASHPPAGIPLPACRPAPPGPAGGRVTVTKHFPRRGFCLVIVFQEAAVSVGRHLSRGDRSRSRSHSASFPGCWATAPAPAGLPRARAQAKVPPRGAGSLALGSPARAPHPAGRPPSSDAAMGTDSRAAGALLARARTLHLQTGNLLNWGRLRKKCPSTHSEEVSAGERGAWGRPRAGRATLRGRQRAEARARGRAWGAAQGAGEARVLSTPAGAAGAAVSSPRVLTCCCGPRVLMQLAGAPPPG